MAFTLSELLGSRDGTVEDNPQRRVLYQLIGDDPATDDETSALAAGLAAAPTTLAGLPKFGASVEALGGDVYTVEVQYRPSSSRIVALPNVGDPTRFRFSTRGQSENIKASPLVFSDGADEGPIPDMNGLINVTSDSVEGVDIIVPAFRETVTRYMDPTVITGAFKRTLRDLTGTVNNADFRGYSSGECLFEGVDGELRNSDGVYELSYEFSIRPNQIGVEVGDIPAFDQEGWDYAWFRTVEQDTTGGLVRVPTHVYIHRTYRRTNFASLGV